MSGPLRLLIVDDEPLARAHLRTLLAADSEVTVVGECGNGRDAVAAVLRDPPDLVLLDIQMPELDGFAVVREVGAERMPAVVFVTAYDEYALQAFEAHALDYVMKPIDRRRFHDAIARAKRLVAHDDASDRREPLAQLVASLAAGTAATPPLTRLALKSEGKITFLKVADISWIEAADDYVRLHVGRDAHLHRDTIARLAARLPASSFLRIHRSTIVNVDMIRELQPWFQGDYVLILKDGTRLTSGRSYRDAVRRLVDEAR